MASQPVEKVPVPDTRIVTVDSENIEKILGERIPENEARVCIAVHSNLDPNQLIDLTLQGYRHIVRNNLDGLPNALNFCQALEKDPERFFNSPLDFLLKAPKQRLEVEFFNKRDKNQVLDQAAAFMDQAEGARWVTQPATLILDECYMNALYDAQDNSGVIEGKVDRFAADVALPEPYKAWMRIAYDDEYLVFGCEDPFGALKLEDFITHLAKFYKKGEKPTPNMGDSGAGLGFGLVFHSTSDIIVAVWPKRKTAVYCRLPLKLSKVQSKKQGKALNLIAIREPADA